MAMAKRESVTVSIAALTMGMFSLMFRLKWVSVETSAGKTSDFCGTSSSGFASRALDPIATAKVEELIYQLRENYTIVIVTHNMQQAARVSDFTAFLLVGQLVEFNPTPQLFTTPSDPRTEAYITGRFG